MVPVSSPTGSRPKAESSRELAALSVATLAAQYASFLLASIFFLRLRRRFFAAMLLTSLVDDRVDPLTGEEVLLRVFDFGSVVEGRAYPRYNARQGCAARPGPSPRRGRWLPTCPEW